MYKRGKTPYNLTPLKLFLRCKSALYNLHVGVFYVVAQNMKAALIRNFTEKTNKKMNDEGSQSAEMLTYFQVVLLIHAAISISKPGAFCGG